MATNGAKTYEMFKICVKLEAKLTIRQASREFAHFETLTPHQGLLSLYPTGLGATTPIMSPLQGRWIRHCRGRRRSQPARCWHSTEKGKSRQRSLSRSVHAACARSLVCRSRPAGYLPPVTTTSTGARQKTNLD